MPSNARLLQHLGLALALAGVVAGAVVYASAAAGDEGEALSQQEARQVERLGGTATVQTVRFNGWLASLWHGERLGWTLGLLGLAVGGACWRVGVLMDEDDLVD